MSKNYKYFKVNVILVIKIFAHSYFISENKNQYQTSIINKEFLLNLQLHEMIRKAIHIDYHNDTLTKVPIMVKKLLYVFYLFLPDQTVIYLN